MNVDLEDGEVKSDDDEISEIKITEEDDCIVKENLSTPSNSVKLNGHHNLLAPPNDDDNVEPDIYEITQDNEEVTEETNDSNPYDKLDPQLIELKIKALKSLCSNESNENASKTKKSKSKSKKAATNTEDDEATTTSSSTLRRGKQQRRKTKSIIDNNKNFYLELGERNLSKLNAHYEKLNDNYEVQDMDLDTPAPHSSSSSSISPKFSTSAQQLAHKGEQQASSYSATLLQTQFVQDQLLYKYYQTAGWFCR
jgi:hypothetical protein